MESKERKEQYSDGEINSDDEEAAYYPHRVRRHSSPRDRSSSRDRGRRERSHSHQRGSSSERGVVRRRDRSRSRSRRRSPHSRHRVRSSDEDDQYDRDGSTHSRDSYSSPRSSRRDLGRRVGEGDDSYHHHGGHFASRGTRGRRFGGYGQTHTYQRGSKYGRGGSGRGTNYGGYANRNFQGREEKQLGSEEVVARLQKGMSLLPPPKEPQCGNLDQFNYPAPPSWYLQEVEEWEERERARMLAKGTGQSDGQQEGNVSVEQRVADQGHVLDSNGHDAAVTEKVAARSSSLAADSGAVCPPTGDGPAVTPGSVAESAVPGIDGVPVSASTPGASSSVAIGMVSTVPVYSVAQGGPVPHSSDPSQGGPPGSRGVDPTVQNTTSTAVMAASVSLNAAPSSAPSIAPADSVSSSSGGLEREEVAVLPRPKGLLEEGGGGEEDMEVCPVSPVPEIQTAPCMAATPDYTSLTDHGVVTSTEVKGQVVGGLVSVGSGNSVSSGQMEGVVAKGGVVSSVGIFGGEKGVVRGRVEGVAEGGVVSNVDVFSGGMGVVSGGTENMVGKSEGVVIGEGENAVTSGGSIGEEGAVSGGGVVSSGGGVAVNLSNDAHAADLPSESGEGCVVGEGDKASKGGLVTEGGVTMNSDTPISPEIATVNIHKQLIKLSEISRVEVYVAPVTEEPSPAMEPQPFQQEATPSATSSQQEAPLSHQVATLPQQETTGTLSLQDVLSQQVEVIGSSPKSTSSPSPTSPSPVAMATTPTPPQISEVMTPVSLGLSGEVAQLQEKEEEEEEPVYSLRSKKGKLAAKRKLTGKKAAAPTLPKVVPSGSGEISYDDYLDQLVEEEEEPVGGLSLSKVLPVLHFPLVEEEEAGNSHTPTLDEQLSEDFPMINGGRREAKEETLQSLVGITPSTGQYYIQPLIRNRLI